MPLRAGPEQAPHLAAARQIDAFSRPEGEVLPLAGLETGTGPCGAGLWGTGLWGTAARHGRQGEPVSGIRPSRSLLGISDGRLYLRGQRGQLVPAALSDGRERLLVEHQPQGDLVWLACPVAARDRRHAKQRAIYAA
jgi:hypothetical protein